MALNTITVRRARADDAATLLPMVQAYRVFYKQRPEPELEEQFLEAHLQHGTSVIYIAEIDGAAAGFTQMFKTYSTVHLAPAWILEDLFVAPEYRRGGIAQALLERAVHHARNDGACGMFLETAHDNNAAQALYEKAGWAREGRFLKFNAPLP